MAKAVVIIPTYNEIENVERMVRTIMDLPIPFDILFVDDSSPDGTAQVIRTMQIEFPNRVFLEEREGKKGLGTAYIHGFKWSLKREYEYIFEMDCDFSHNPEDLMKLYDACSNNGADLAIGSRYIKGVNVVNWPMGRILMSYYASAYVRFITGLKIRDTTSGFKCYTQKVLSAIDLSKIKFKGYAFQIEMKFAAVKLGFKVIEIPIIFTDRQQGASKMSGGIFKEAVFGVIQMKFLSWFKSYKK